MAELAKWTNYPDLPYMKIEQLLLINLSFRNIFWILKIENNIFINTQLISDF